MDTKENELFQKLLDERFLALRDTIKAEVGGLRKDVEHGFETLRRQITEGLDDAAKERLRMSQKNHDQDETLRNHEKRISTLEELVRRYRWLLAGVSPFVLWAIYQALEALADALTK